jgi:hypothetical protein
MRKMVLAQVAVLALVAAAPMMAQGGGGMGGMNMGGRAGDPTTIVMGTGQLPAGWMMRFDPVRAGQPQHDPKEVSFVTMGDGFHFKSGPAAIYYNSKDIGKGEYSVSATFAQAKSSQHETYGLFIAGANLQDSAQTYLYFVIRPLDGVYLIKKRESNARPASPAPTTSSLIVKDDVADGHATNTLMIHVAKDSVHFIANGKLVKGMSKAELGMNIDGQVGVRINHNLDVHMSGYTFKKY